MNRRVAVIAAYALMCGIWGTTWLGIKFSLRYVPPVAGAGLRFMLAGVLMYAIAAARGAIPQPRDVPWKLVGVMAIFLFGLNYVLTYTAESHLASGLVAVLFGVLPFFMFLFGHHLIDERTTPLTWAGAVLAFAGVAVISLEANLAGSIWYALAAIGSAASSAFANVYAKRHAEHDPLVTLPPSMLIAGMAMAAGGFLAEHPSVQRAFSLPSWGVLLYLAVLGSGLAFFLNLWLLARIPAWVVGFSSLIIPVIAVIVGVFAGGESFGLRELAGVALVIAGVWLALSAGRPAAERSKNTTG